MPYGPCTVSAECVFAYFGASTVRICSRLALCGVSPRTLFYKSLPTSRCALAVLCRDTCVSCAT